LRELCVRIGLEWDAAMLSWPAGPRPEDGPWSRYWYENVERSTGFSPYRPSDREVPDTCRELLAECRAFYDELKSSAILSKPEVP
jgi:hypothetical protein